MLIAVDLRLREKFLQLPDAATRRTGDGYGSSGGNGGGGSGSTSDIADRVGRLEIRFERQEVRMDGFDRRMAAVERRLDRVETRLDGIETRLRRVDQDIKALSAKVDILTTQIVAKLPSWWQMPAVIGATVARLAALWALLARTMGLR